jgi:hypothetical protein
LKFLIKLEEAIDNIIINLIDKIKKGTPHSVYNAIDWVKHIPELSIKNLKIIQAKLRIFLLKFIGYSKHYTTMLRGHLITINLYFKSDEFKKANKVDLALAPIIKFKTDPIKAFGVLLAVIFLSTTSFLILKNTEKIIVGTKALRAPASVAVEEEPSIEFKKLKYELMEKELFLDITVTTYSIEERNKLIPSEKEIEELLLKIKIHAAQLPLSKDDITKIEEEMKTLITGAKIKDVAVKQVLESRPKYFMQTEKLFAMKNLNLQLFLEDTKRNRQVWIDYTALSSNRNVVLFLNDHLVEIQDYLNIHVEPVIPQLPIEEEGRQIIKEKVKLEINNFLKTNEIEGKILEVYMDYIMVS